MSTRPSLHGQWSSRLTFILAATGAAVGLGNIWKFPYIAGIYGGGAFVAIYLLCIALLGIPIMTAEIMIGRRGRQNPAGAIATLAKDSNRSRHWGLVGGLSILAGFLILTYYSVIAGWAADYIILAAKNSFHQASAEEISAIFNNLISSPNRLLFWHTLMIGTTVLVVSLGVEHGLERSIRYLFPTMLFLLLAIVGYSVQTGYFGVGLHFLFAPDFSEISAEGVLAALGHAFFTLSLATGSIMMYGAYVPQDISISRAAILIALADTFIALIAGLAIFPIVFANQLEPGAGPGLIFQSLPIAFGQIPYGHFFGTIFFVMLVFAAFTSTISLLEPSVAWLMERFKIRRSLSALLVGFVIWFLGLGSVYSFNYWSDFHIFGKTIFDFSDYLTANIMLPLGGLFIAIFTAWYMRKESVREELQSNGGLIFKLWYNTLAYVSPIAIGIVFLNSIGLLNFLK